MEKKYFVIRGYAGIYEEVLNSQERLHEGHILVRQVGTWLDLIFCKSDLKHAPEHILVAYRLRGEI